MSRSALIRFVSTVACVLAGPACMVLRDGDAERAPRGGEARMDQTQIVDGDDGAEPALHSEGTCEPDEIAQDYVRIRNPATDRCLTVATGELVALATGCSTSSLFQRWDVIGDCDGPWEIVSVGASDALGEEMCLTLGVPEPGAEPTLNPCDGSVSQAWEVAPAPGKPGQFYISNLDQFLEAGSGGPNVTVGFLAELGRQRWRLSP